MTQATRHDRASSRASLTERRRAGLPTLYQLATVCSGWPIRSTCRCKGCRPLAVGFTAADRDARVVLCMDYGTGMVKARLAPWHYAEWPQSIPVQYSSTLRVFEVLVNRWGRALDDELRELGQTCKADLIEDHVSRGWVVHVAGHDLVRTPGWPSPDWLPSGEWGAEESITVTEVLTGDSIEAKAQLLIDRLTVLSGTIMLHFGGVQ